MKGQIIVLVFCVITVSLAKPPPTFLEYKDSLGQYSFGYSAPGSARSEVRSIDGTTRGSYSYVDDSGMIQSAQYTADGQHGFRVIATNLPQAPIPVEDTPEVIAARNDHLKALEAASKIADEMPEMEAQRSIVKAEETDSIMSDNAVKPDEEAMDMQVQAKIAENSRSMVQSSSMESQGETSDEGQMPVAKIAGVENEGEAMKIEEKSDQETSNEEKQSEAKSVGSSRSDVPVVTTSFVIPGSVNLHTRIELDQSNLARIIPEPAPLFASQPSIFQADEANPSMLTPAATRTMTMSESEKSKILSRMSPLTVAATTLTKSAKPQEYSSAIITGVVAPSNAFALAYGIGVDPIYHQYNPYSYFPYGIL